MTDDADRLERAAKSTTLRKVVIDPVTRVEGHGKVTLLMDDEDRVQQARLHIVEFRGFEKFVQGRPYWELPVLVQRLCGICPVSHHLAAAKAVDRIVGVSEIPPTAQAIRQLLHLGQVLQSHALHFFHLSSPDLLFGSADEVRHRNFIGVLQDHPEIALQGIKLRKFGQQIIEAIAGKRIHGVIAVPGGVNKSLDKSVRQGLAEQVDDILAFAEGALDLAKRLFLSDREAHQQFARADSAMLSLVTPDGAMELYDGGLRAKDCNGDLLFDHFSPDNYLELISEEVKEWSYMKFPFLNCLGREQGMYRVGPLARINSCDYIDTPKAEAARVELTTLQTPLVQSTLAFHWARMIELLHCVEAIDRLLGDDILSGGDLCATDSMTGQGIGVIEAPRGTLIHDYQAVFIHLVVMNKRATGCLYNTNSLPGH